MYSHIIETYFQSVGLRWINVHGMASSVQYLLTPNNTIQYYTCTILYYTILGIQKKKFGRISYRFRDIDAFSSKIAYFPPPLLDVPGRGKSCGKVY